MAQISHSYNDGQMGAEKTEATLKAEWTLGNEGKQDADQNKNKPLS